MSIVQTLSKALLVFVFASSLSVAGCRGQLPPVGDRLSPELARRVELLIRQRTKMTPDYSVVVGARKSSEIPGFDQVDVTFTSGEGEASKPIAFLLSKDGRTLAQLSKYDISADPKSLISAAGRPGRGGPETAPVEIVMFDDLECPFCAKMHAELFPALTERYGQQVRIVYRDFPLSQHPWAMRAAIDSNCVGTQSAPGYWNLVDKMHARASDFGGNEHSLAKANEELDKLTLDEASKDGLKLEPIAACVKKQDDTEVKASLKLGGALGIEATPVLFINGEKLEGAYPLQDVFRMIDGALVAEGKTAPPAYVLPATPAAKTGK